MYWKIYRKDNGRYVDRRWYLLDATAEDVYDDLEPEFCFWILISPDNGDDI